MDELQWQKLNAFLRVIMIVILITLAVLVVYYGMSPCSRCYFCDERTGQLPQFKTGQLPELKESGLRKCTTATDVFREYANKVVLSSGGNRTDLLFEAVSDVLNNLSFEVVK